MLKEEELLLKRISKYRDLILFLEAGALLHDVGKLSSFFIISKAKGLLTKDFHGQIVFIDLEYPDYKKRKIGHELEKFLLTPLYELLDSEKSIKGIDLSITLSHFICAHHGCSRCLNFVYDCKFKDTIENHPLIKLLKTVDHLDASNPQDSGKQGIYSVYRDNFFLKETPISVKDLNKERENFYKEVEKLINLAPRDFTKKLKALSKKHFIKTLSETRRHGNDITLLDHSESVSSFYKAYLFNYFIRNERFPDSFFKCNFRIMRVKKNSNSDVENKISYELALANKIFESDRWIYFLIPPIRSESFFRFLETYLQSRIEVSKLNDFSYLFSDTLKGKKLSPYYERLKKYIIKTPRDISESYTEKEVIDKVKEIIYFAILRKKESYARKLKSYSKHLENVKNGIEHSEKNLKKYYKKKKEIEILEKRLNAGIPIAKIKQAFGWHSSKDGEKSVYDFFNLTLSPIRPPSPVDMANYFLKEYNKIGSFKGVYRKLIEKRPTVLGRVLAYLRTIENEFGIGEVSDKISEI